MRHLIWAALLLSSCSTYKWLQYRKGEIARCEARVGESLLHTGTVFGSDAQKVASLLTGSDPGLEYFAYRKAETCKFSFFQSHVADECNLEKFGMLGCYERYVEREMSEGTASVHLLLLAQSSFQSARMNDPQRELREKTEPHWLNLELLDMQLFTLEQIGNRSRPVQFVQALSPKDRKALKELQDFDNEVGNAAEKDFSRNIKLMLEELSQAPEKLDLSKRQKKFQEVLFKRSIRGI